MVDFYTYKYICPSNKVIEPYKYYAKKKEELYCVYFSKGNKKIFIHKRNNKLLTIYCNKKLKLINPDPYIKKYTKRKDFYRKVKEIFELYEKKLIFDNSIQNTNTKILRGLKHPVFIVGCGRSGTSLLLSILSCSKQLYTIQDESYVFYPGGVKANLILDEVSKNKSKNIRIIEKTPKHIQALNKINEFYDGRVKFIHITRDPRAVLVSKHPNHSKKYWVTPKRWINDVKKGNSYCKKNIIQIKYEDLVSDFENIIKNICNFLKIDFDIKMRKFEKFASLKENVAFQNSYISKLNPNMNMKFKNKKFKNRIYYILQNKEIIKVANNNGYYFN